MFVTEDETKALQDVKDYIDLSSPERVEINHLIMISGLTKTKLTRGFKYVFNITIYRYWLERAMTIAKAMIEDGMQVKEASIMLKYSTIGSFARAFKSVHKTNPAEFKKQ
ncbi:AraC family transcriptional regulator [Chitinophaga sedimenti]|uniref:helix-turn-helix domain-containing protein n=1 Tax=Chitinophaga sedimenti TaxID=2033606 RepID=UPI002004423D|nr:AraC family transcriptional regulator [Chitinophaga sedimenti]MCK7553749.1 AraC family transcriptional regulator [Chitinophaga sedimenti]